MTYTTAKIAWRKRRADEIRQLLSEFRKNGCIVCGELEECCLDAHHLNPSEKEYNIPKLITRGYSLEKVKQELAKCVCVCSNCHRKIHAGVTQLA